MTLGLRAAGIGGSGAYCVLRAADVAARRTKVNRSALIREALRAHLKTLAIRQRELRDRKGYEVHPRGSEDLSSWKAAAIWPEE